MKEFETIKWMRESVIYEKMNFNDFLEIYDGGDKDRKHLGKLWSKALELVPEEKWKKRLRERFLSKALEFQDAINDWFEDGACITDMASEIGVDSKLLSALL